MRFTKPTWSLRIVFWVFNFALRCGRDVWLLRWRAVWCSVLFKIKKELLLGFKTTITPVSVSALMAPPFVYLPRLWLPSPDHIAGYLDLDVKYGCCCRWNVGITEEPPDNHGH
ncbi:uncharacterized protein K444DRAFT_93699 [Hyaloscypha bicolor E]|uniref:Uncharacterized protein n=1 Tax=Hyaloscypha bicolor E TaxID=1095630 RepID=A0A2J6SVW9_9HELO|nr:uncharacterized protein K444DRAFT_93699 [Hyaloscypha bicolor E]PMD54925.1 hypothetical protein K444DRAFT_93699 [Hyaloscypha bicolor E]